MAALLFSPQAFAQTKPAKAVAKPSSLARIPPPGPAELPLLQARDFSDSRSLIDITVPAGWVVMEVASNQKNENASLILLEGPGAPAPSCKIVLRVPKQPPKISQAQINKIMHDERNLQMMRKSLGQGGREVLSITKVSNRGLNGLQAKLLVPGSDRRPDVIMAITFYEAVGQAYSFECSALSADIDNVGTDLDAIVRSARLTKS